MRDNHHPRPVRVVPRYANPWRYRKNCGVEPIAGPTGTRVHQAVFRRNGEVGFVVTIAAPLDETPRENDDPSMLVELRRRVAAEIARYRMSGEFTPTEIRTVEALWQEGLGLRELARLDGVSAQAVLDRLQRLASKAPRFCRWWRIKNRCRARR